MTWGKIHKVSDNRFQMKGSPLLFIYPSASDSQIGLLKHAANMNYLVKVVISKKIGGMAILKGFKVDKYRTRERMNTRQLLALGENRKNMQELDSNKNPISGLKKGGFHTGGV